MNALRTDGPLWVILFFGLVYSWLIFNAALLLAGRLKRFSLKTLLIVMTIVSALLGAMAATGWFEN
jgi:hypothetical protein